MNFEIIGARIGQVIMLRNDIDFSETSCWSSGKLEFHNVDYYLACGSIMWNSESWVVILFY